MVSYPRDEIHAMNFGAMMMYESLLATAEVGRVNRWTCDLMWWKVFFSLGWKGAYSLVQEKILGKVWHYFKYRDSTKVTCHFLVVFDESFSSMAPQLCTSIPLDSLSQRPLGSHEFRGCGKCEFPRSNSKSRILGSQGLALFGHGHLGCITYLLSLGAIVGWMGWSIYNININSLGYSGKQTSESKTGSFTVSQNWDLFEKCGWTHQSTTPFKCLAMQTHTISKLHTYFFCSR